MNNPGQSESERIIAIIDGVSRVYTPEGVGLWLLGRHRRLPAADGFLTPLEALRAGDIEAVENIVPAADQVAT